MKSIFILEPSLNTHVLCVGGKIEAKGFLNIILNKNMKNILLIPLLFVILIGNIKAQNTKELSNAEKFSVKSGTLIKKEYVKIGLIKRAEMKIVYYVDLINNVKQSALRFECSSTNKYSTNSKIAILDADEIDGLIKSIKHIQSNIFIANPVNYTEVSFKSRGGFEAGCFWSDDKWSAYIKLEKYDNDSYVFLEKEDFDVLLNLLEQSKLKL